MSRVVNNKILMLNESSLTASGVGDTISIPSNVSYFVWDMTIGTVTGTSPSLTMDIDYSLDGVNWLQYTTDFDPVTTSDAYSMVRPVSVTNETYASPVFPFVRCNYTITGTTPSFADVIVYYWYARAFE